MPGQDLNLHSPETAARDAVERVLSTGSQIPLVDAAGLLIEACRSVDPSEPRWAEFLAAVDRAELECLTRIARDRLLRVV